MLAYIARRILVAVPLLIAVLFATFVLLYALPGDPTHALLGKNWTEAAAERIREEEGLNDPVVVQFGRYLGEVFTDFDLGTNHQKKPVVDELATRLPATIELALAAMLIALVVGVSAGIISALRPRSWRDMTVLTGALAGVSLPIFWLGLIVQRLFRRGGYFSEKLDWEGLPLGGRMSESVADRMQQMSDHAEFVTQQPLDTTGFHLFDTLFVFRDWSMFTDALAHLVLPALVLSTVPAAFITRITRTAVGEQLNLDYARTARAKGVGGSRVVLRHVLRNAAIPIVTSAGTMLGYLLAGAVLTETIFNWPGMGTWIVDAIMREDVRQLQAGVLVIAIGFIVVNLLVDLSYALLDPRVRLEGGVT